MRMHIRVTFKNQEEIAQKLKLLASAWSKWPSVKLSIARMLPWRLACVALMKLSAHKEAAQRAR